MQYSLKNTFYFKKVIKISKNLIDKILTKLKHFIQMKNLKVLKKLNKLNIMKKIAMKDTS